MRVTWKQLRDALGEVARDLRRALQAQLGSTL
jgi:hypothetical protein